MQADGSSKKILRRNRDRAVAAIAAQIYKGFGR